MRMKRDPSIFRPASAAPTPTTSVDNGPVAIAQRLDGLEHTTRSLQQQIEKLTTLVSLETKALSLQLTQMQRGQAAAAEIG